MIRKGIDATFIKRIAILMGLLMTFIVLIVFVGGAATNFDICGLIDGINSIISTVLPFFTGDFHIPCPDFLKFGL